MFNCILLFLILIALYKVLQYYKKKDCVKNIENFNTEKIFYNQPVESENIKFDYDIKEIDKQFIKEQENGFRVASYVANNPDGSNREDFIETKALFTYEFNEPRTLMMDGVVDPVDSGKTLKEVYDNSFINFKKLIPKKEMINTDDATSLEGASNLSFFTNDDWVYDNEKPENGGEIKRGLYANDEFLLNSNAIY